MMKLGRAAPSKKLLATTCVHQGFNFMMASSLCVKRFVDGGAKNRNLMQLLHACFAAQKLHEMGEFRETWRNMNNMHFGEKFQ